jgi:signal transduction histidine kinase
VLLELRPDDLRAAVEDAVEQAEGAAAKRRIALRLHLPDQPVRIRHDPQRIGQVVQNLVLNAIKFTGRSGSVDVSLESVEDGARIAVVDTGVGIDAEELPHIFERFYRGSQANEARGSGSGLGLAIVRSIVDMHGGSIEVESQVGRGSRFTVILPADPRVAEGTPPVSQSAVVGSDATDRTAGATAPETAL